MNEQHPTVLDMNGATLPRLEDCDFARIGGQLAREFNDHLPEPMRLQPHYDQPIEMRAGWEQVARRAFAEIAKRSTAVERPRKPPSRLKGGTE